MTTEEAAPGAVCVIGGTSGIGRAVAGRLRAMGHPVTVVGRREEAGRKVSRDIGADFVAADSSSHEQMQRVLSELKHRGTMPVGLVVSGGTQDADHAKAPTEEALKSAFVAQFSARIQPVLTIAPAMAEAGYGKIVVLSTVAGLAASRGQWLAGSLAAATIYACRSLAAEYARAGVRINVAALTLVRGSGFDQRRLAGLVDPTRAAMMERVIERLPLGPPNLDDAVSTITHLLSPTADAVTGNVVTLGGGLVV